MLASSGFAVPVESCAEERHRLTGTAQNFRWSCFFNPLSSKNVVDLSGQFKIQIANALHTVGVQVNHHFVPYVEPFRMMIHGLGHECNSGHVSERCAEVLTLELSVQ